MKIRLPRRRRRIRWTFNTLIIVLALLVGVAFFWRLGTLTPGLSPTEATAASASLSGETILQQPHYAPHKVLQFIAHKLGGDIALLRFVSALFGLVIVACFYFIASRWFGRTVSILTTALFASSPWLLIHAHNATPYILLAWPVAILAAFIWLRTTKEYAELATIAVAVSIAIGLYIPGVVWIVVLGVALASRQALREIRKKCSKQLYSIAAAIVVLALIPLVLATINDTNVIKSLLLLPDSWPGLTDFTKAAGWALVGIVWRTRDGLDTTLGNLPVLDMLGIMLVLLGSVTLFTQYKRWRSWWLAGSMLIVCVLVGLHNNPLLILLALPAVFFTIGIGLQFLHREWFSVFPKNPIAKYAALSIMSVAVVFSVLYGVRYSLIAWPRAPETTSVYVIQ